MRAADRFEFAPPPTAGLVRSLGLAIVAHALLLAALTWGINWKSSAVLTVAEAELWSAVPQQAAPKLVEPPPAPPTPQPAPPAKAAPVVPDASIALERDKQRLKKEQQEARDKLEKQQKIQKDILDKLKREQEKKQAELDKRKEALKAQDEAKKLEAQRQANIQRATGLANASGAATATGTAQQSSGPSAGYAGKIMARIKSNTSFADPAAGNLTVVVIVRAAPNGTITSRRIVTPSGNKAWDEAVLRAIDKMEFIPPDTDGKIPGILLRDGLELTVSL